jgi:two-component system NtrC family sensor kinase
MVQRFINTYHSIRFRLIVPVVVIIALVVSVFAYLNARHQQLQYIRLLKREATQFTEALVRSLRPAMMNYDVEGIREIVKNVGSQEGVEKVRLYSKIIRTTSGAQKGESQIKIQYSSDESEAGRVMDITKRQCMVCHAQEEPLTRYQEGEHRIFTNVETGHRVLGVIHPIYNEESCYTASCHAHDRDQRVLGVFDVIVNLEEADRQITSSTWTFVAFTGLLILLLTVFIGVSLRQFVVRPVALLTNAVHKVSEGDLTQGIDIAGKDEFGQLARAFNNMTGDLSKAKAEIEESGRRLEARVEERTAALRAAQEQILQSEKLASLGKLAASVAHEINNPLTGILTFIRIFQEWVRDKDFPPEKIADFREFLQIMADETLRSSKIVHNLLAFSRRSRLDVKPTAINSVIEQCLNLVAHQLELQEVDVTTSLAGDLPQIPMDHGQIQQTLVNILLNASEAMPRGGRVTVASRMAEEPGWIQVSVSDEGVGIPAEDLAQLFDPFFTTKEEGKGTGLGLSVVYGIIEKHGGRIEVESEVGKGTTFHLFLPVDGGPEMEGEGEVS